MCKTSVTFGIWASFKIPILLENVDFLTSIKSYVPGSYEGNILKGVITCIFFKNLSKLLFWLCPTTFSEAHKFLLTVVRRRVPKPEKPSTFKKSFNHDWKLTLHVPICNLEWCLVTHDLHAKDHHATMRLETTCFLQRLTVIITPTISFFRE